MIISHILLLQYLKRATLIVLGYGYRPPPNKESDEISNILSLVISNDIEVIRRPISNKPHPINRQYLNSKTLLHVFILLHPEEHISLQLVHKDINLFLYRKHSCISFSLSAFLSVVKISRQLLHLKNATVAANRRAANPLCATCKHGHTECAKTLMKNADIYLQIVKMTLLTPLPHATLYGHANCAKSLLEIQKYQHLHTRYPWKASPFSFTIKQQMLESVLFSQIHLFFCFLLYISTPPV